MRRSCMALGIFAALGGGCGEGASSSGADSTAGAGGVGAGGNNDGGTGGQDGAPEGGAGGGQLGGAGGAGGAGGPDVLFADDFDRPDTIGGLDNGWVVNDFEGSPLDTTFDLQGEAAYPFYGSTTGGLLFHTIASAFRPTPFEHAHMRIAVDVRADGGDYDGVMVLIARSQTTSSELSDYYFCGTLAAVDRLYIMRVAADVVQDLAISDPGVLPLPNGTTSRLTFTLDGDQLTCELSGARSAVLTATDATFGSGYVGMAGGKPGANWLRFDDFVIEAL
jgi:hypothetical protein